MKQVGSDKLETELPNRKKSDHPDNKSLVKRSSGDDYSPLDHARGCTDFLFLLLIICSWAAMTSLGLASMGLIPSEHVKKGDPSRLVNGLDYHGNVCGITNYVTPTGEDVINLPMAYPMPSGFFVCVLSCPTVSNFEEFICEYEVRHEIDTTLNSAASIGGSLAQDISTKKSLHLFYTAQKQCMPMIQSSSFLGYCIPSKPMDDILLTNPEPIASNDTASIDQNPTLGTDSTTSLIADVEPGFNVTSNETFVQVSVSGEKRANLNGDVFDMVMADVQSVRYVIFSFGCGMAMALGIIFLVIIQLPGLLSLIVWSMILAVDGGLVAGGYYSKGVSESWAASGRPGNEARALYYGAFILYGLAGVWFVAICFLRRSIIMAIACVKEASRAISAMPIMTLFPVVQVLSLFAFTLVWSVYMTYLASSGDIETKCICPEFDQGFSSLGEGIIPSPSPIQSNLPVERLLGSASNCTEGCFMYKELTYSTNTKYSGLFMVFVWFWTSQFIVAVGQLVVAVAVSVWYFTRDRSKLGNSTFIKSVYLVCVHHLGTAAFGSLIIAVIKTIRTVQAYMIRRASKSRLRVAVVLLKVLQTVTWCLEKCLKFVSKQSYIQTALFSHSFCKAAREGFYLIIRNALRISAASIVSQTILFILKAFITVASTVCGYYYLDIYFGDQLNYMMVPTLLIAIFSYAVSEMFDEVFGMAISTILQCAVADEEMFDPPLRYAPTSLMGTLESTQRRYGKKRFGAGKRISDNE